MVRRRSRVAPSREAGAATRQLSSAEEQALEASRNADRQRAARRAAAADPEDGILQTARYVAFGGLVVLGVLYAMGKLGNWGGRRNLSTAGPETGHEWGVSCGHVQESRELLPTADPGGAWAGDAEGLHKVQNTLLGELASQLAGTGRQVKAVVQTQAEQVGGGRETLGNIVNGIDLAIPVSHALYFSGPAGPAISLQFQLAIAGSATGTSVDTINAMHENAQDNAERLNALTRKYDEMLGRLSAAADVS